MRKKRLGRKSGSGVVFISLSTFGHTSLQLKGNLREWECLFYLTSIYFCVPQTDENKVDGVSAAKGQVGTPAVVRETEGRKTTGRKRTGKMAKRITTPDLHLSQRQVKKIQPRSSVLQANMLLSTLTVKMKMREITRNRPLHSVVSPSLSPPWNIREQIKPLSRQDKIKVTISWRPFLT